MTIRLEGICTLASLFCNGFSTLSLSLYLSRTTKERKRGEGSYRESWDDGTYVRERESERERVREKGREMWH